MRKRREVVAVVKSVVTQDKASQALYRQLFPNTILVSQYKASQAKKKHEEKQLAMMRKERAKTQMAANRTLNDVLDVLRAVR